MVEENALAKAIAALDNRTVVEGRWFHDTTIKLDGYTFKGCRFDKCILWYQTADFRIVACKFDENTFIAHGDPGLLAIRAYNLNDAGVIDYFAPVYNADGTVSIDWDSR